MRRVYSILYWICLAFIAVHAEAANVVSAPGDIQNRKLILDFWVNSVDTGVVGAVVDRGGKWLAERADLIKAGINPNTLSPANQRLVEIASLSGVNVEVDSTDERLVLTAQASWLTPQAIDFRRSPAVAQSSSTTGLVASYNITGTTGIAGHDSGSESINAALAATLFAPFGTLFASGYSQALDGTSQSVRLDTTAEWDDPGSLRRILVGDAISGGLSWSRNVRFGGFQLATDFTLQPGLITWPLPAFFGQTAVPGAVDVFVNSAHIFEGNLAPGPFQINDLPVVTGSGQAMVVVRNVLGQETTQTFSFYTSDALLQEGLSSYDFDVGILRDFYGEKNFDYGGALASGTYRYGISNWLTAEAHAEVAQNIQLVGGGADFGIGALGTAGADLAVSNSPMGYGALYSLSFDSQTRPFGLFGSGSITQGHYADIASVGATPPSRLRIQLGGNVGLDRDGSVAVSFISDKVKGEKAAQLLSASYALSFADGWYFSASGLHDCGSGAWAGELTLSIPVDSGLIGTVSAQAGSGATSGSATIAQPANPDGGFGYSVSGSGGQLRGADAQTSWIGDQGTVEGEVSSVNGETAARISAAGALVEMNGEVFAARAPNGAIALVNTGAPSVPVYLENRQVAVSDSDGEALLTNLTANAPNRISIDPTDYSFATIITNAQQTVIPARRSGVAVDLAPPTSHPAIVTLLREDGTPVAIGSRVDFTDGSAPLVVGHDGQVFVTDLEKRLVGNVTEPDGSCHFAIDPPDHFSANLIPKIGAAICRRSTSL
jgi:outer membrane usher protein